MLVRVRNCKFRLYPTRLQEQRLTSTWDGCRWVYNYFVKYGTSLTEYDMNYAITELKEQEPWLRNYHSKMLQMVAKQMAAATKGLQMLRKNGHKVGRLHYLMHEECNSFIYNQSGFKIKRGGKTDLLWLSKIGCIQIRLHRPIGDIKQVTVVRKAGKWHAIVNCDLAAPIFRFISLAKSVGIDLGVTKFVHDSDNHSIDNPLVLNKMLKPLRRTNRRLSRKQENSKNQEKAKTRLQLLHERIRNQRLDFLHKTSTYYSNRYDAIFLEKLRIANMVKNHNLARSIIDSGWSTFKNMLAYKTKLVIEVPPNNTSIDCSRCGNRVSKSLAVRTHRCDECGLVINRDYNASLNIKQKGLRQIKLQLLMGYEEVTPVEILGESVKQEETTRIDQVVVHTVDAKK